VVFFTGPQGTVAVFLVEKKNKERAIIAHNIKRGGKVLELGEEFSAYDKVLVVLINLKPL